MNYDDMSAGNLLMKTCAFPLLGAFDLSGSALRIEKKKRAPFFEHNQRSYLTHPRVPYLHVIRPSRININNLIFAFSGKAEEMERERNYRRIRVLHSNLNSSQNDTYQPYFPYFHQAFKKFKSIRYNKFWAVCKTTGPHYPFVVNNC